MKKLSLPKTLIAYSQDRLFGRFFRTPTPFSLLIMKDGSGVLEQSPTQSNLNEAEFYFYGGHKYELTEDQITAIENAGFGIYIEDVEDVSDGLPVKEPRILRSVPKSR